MAGTTPTTGQTVQPSVFQQSSGAYNAALGAAGGAVSRMAYRPITATPTMMGAAPTVQAGQVGQTSMAPYMNPYTSAVVDTTMADLNRGRQMAIQQVGDQAAAARAFGGSRHGIAEAETNRAFADQAARTAAGLRQDAFTNAQGMAQFDIGNRFAADQFNAGNAMAVNSANAGAANQFALANQSAQMGQDANLLSGANMLAQLSQQGFNMGRTLNADVAGVGAQQQALQQMLIDAARAQFQQYAQAPQQAIQLPLAAVGAANMGQQTQTTSQQPGLFNILGLALGMMP